MTEFYCCDEFEEAIHDMNISNWAGKGRYGATDLEYGDISFWIKFCPFCGRKLSTL